MFAVVEMGGKQYRVKVGDVIQTEKVVADIGRVVELEKVILIGEKVDAKSLGGAKVTAEVLEHKKTDKVIVFKKKRRHNYRRKRGHRQQITVMRVKEIIS
ncbi:MAG: 50S ribosomal protein L21 [Candidatus Midichloria sp.]|uniref:Large ribosomal subunit protein bL21m n=1 Tax=Hyalomma marginatum TaxID=34627 RepID=A0A8S4C212_9ACAR|nr:50S ribosomal protein L21 [Candidatus Midichloria sp.]CAG7593512.1 50S ribosomal protein L21 [Hyalomma marginatum]CAG7594405.1 50S ribosomal protein L21 [Hyalomma marginatum]